MVFKLQKSILLWILAIAFLLVCGTFALQLELQKTAVKLPISDYVIIIDAGHGGLDGGAQSESGVLEKDINLKIAKLLQQYLEKNGASVIMTRTKDVSLHRDEDASIRTKKRQDLLKRRDIANTQNADFMVSIHLNQFSESRYRGAQMFYETNHTNSKKLAECLQNAIRNSLDSDNNRQPMPIASDKLQFKNLRIPAVIAECGFLSNSEESLMLDTEEYQRKVAYAVFLGILSYVNC